MLLSDKDMKDREVRIKAYLLGRFGVAITGERRIPEWDADVRHVSDGDRAACVQVLGVERNFFSADEYIERIIEPLCQVLEKQQLRF